MIDFAQLSAGLINFVLAQIWQAYQGPDQIKLEIVVFPI